MADDLINDYVNGFLSKIHLSWLDSSVEDVSFNFDTILSHREIAIYSDFLGVDSIFLNELHPLVSSFFVLDDLSRKNIYALFSEVLAKGSSVGVLSSEEVVWCGRLGRFYPQVNNVISLVKVFSHDKLFLDIIYQVYPDEWLYLRLLFEKELSISNCSHPFSTIESIVLRKLITFLVDHVTTLACCNTHDNRLLP